MCAGLVLVTMLRRQVLKHGAGTGTGHSQLSYLKKEVVVEGSPMPVHEHIVVDVVGGRKTVIRASACCVMRRSWVQIQAIDVFGFSGLFCELPRF